MLLLVSTGEVMLSMAILFIRQIQFLKIEFDPLALEILCCHPVGVGLSMLRLSTHLEKNIIFL